MAGEHAEQLSWDLDVCAFCDLFAGAAWLPFRQLFSVEEAPSELIYETAHFGVAADIGLMVEGYSLIISRAHVPSLACAEHLDELDEVKRRLRAAVQAAYGPVVAFEHGAASEQQKAGCCIDHAHLHVVPAAVDLLPWLEQSYAFRPIAHLSELRALAGRQGYLYYENQAGRAFAAEVEQVPPQYLRRVLRQALGLNAPWNWREYVLSAQALGTKDRIARTRERVGAGLGE